MWQRERGILSPDRYQGFGEACASEPTELTVHVDPGDLDQSASFDVGRYWLAYKPYAEYSDEKGDYSRPLVLGALTDRLLHRSAAGGCNQK